MKYDLKVIQLYTEKQKDKSYKLSNYSKNDLIKLSNELRKANHSSALIFASCFTFYSKIKELMIANGVLAALNISKDLGEITEDKAYQHSRILKSNTCFLLGVEFSLISV